VISVNGNAAALVPEGLVALSKILDAPLEVNIFHTSSERERAIRQHLLDHGAHNVLLPTMDAQLPEIDSNRRFVHPDGLLRSDVVFVPLEDGDRCEALRRIGKDVITVDLNPMSRTARSASITIVDNIVRAAPLLLAEVAEHQQATTEALEIIVSEYRNDVVLREAVHRIRAGQ
jgi:4-phosphopantoate--beta-alanine ligase